MTLGEKIQALHKQSGLSQEALAEKLAVTRQTVSKWELNRSLPDLDFIARFSEIFEVSADYLIKNEITAPDGTPSEASDRPQAQLELELPSTVFNSSITLLLALAWLWCGFSAHPKSGGQTMKTILLHRLGQTAKDWEAVTCKLSAPEIDCPELFALPQAELNIVPGAGHEVNKDAPEVIAEFLNRNRSCNA